MSIHQGSSSHYAASTYSENPGQPSNSLGLEKHVRNVFNQTQTTINTLNNDLEKQKKRNEELQWKLNDLAQQKEQLLQKNKQLDLELIDCKEQTDNLLKAKNDYKAQLGEMKKELQGINDDWELKKKQLQHQINQLKDEQLLLQEEKSRENASFKQAELQYKNKINSLNGQITSAQGEIKKFERMISKLKEKEKFSMDTIMTETQRFKEFLDSQSEKKE